MTEDDDIRAAEHALGLTDESAREAGDPAFAEAVETWRERFDPLLGPERAAPAAMWSRIVARLPANDAGPVRDPARPWRFATFAASAAAAVLLGIVVLRPGGDAPVSPPPVATAAASRMMVAALMPEAGAGMVSVTYDGRDGRMMVNPVRMDPQGRTPELWVIPAGGKPHSLGVIPARSAAAMIVPEAERRMMAGGATLAVSLEPEGGSPTGGPTGPVVMTGALTTV